MFSSLKVRAILSAFLLAVSMMAASCSGIVSLDNDAVVPQDEIVSGRTSGHSSEGD